MPFIATFLFVAQTQNWGGPQVPIQNVADVLNLVMNNGGTKADWDKLNAGKSATTFEDATKTFHIRYRPTVDGSKLARAQWKLSTPDERTAFANQLVSKLHVPFKDYDQNTFEVKDGSDVVKLRVRIEEKLDGLFTGSNSLSFTFDCRTSEFDSIQYVSGWKPHRETWTLKDSDADDEIRKDGAYDSKTTFDRWVPLPWTESNETGPAELVKARLYIVKRGTYAKTYWFRTNGTFFMTTDNKSGS